MNDIPQYNTLKVLERMCEEEKSCVASCAKYTEKLIKLCEKLAKHSLSTDASSSLAEKRTIVNFALLLSFDPEAKTIILKLLPTLKHIQHMLQSNDNKLKESTVIFIHNVYNFGTS